jgi:DNA-binding CsgD family transcriptional regulator
MKRRQAPSPPSGGAGSGAALEQGREAFRQRAWSDAFQALSAADQQAPLAPDDLHLLALSAALSGRDTIFLALLERLHHQLLAAGAGTRAARAAFWLASRLLSMGEAGQAAGWLARAQRLVDQEVDPCAEQGFLLLPQAQRQLATGDLRAAHDTAARAAEIGERFRDPDLLALARHLQGRALLRMGQPQRGLELLDEVMVAAKAGELLPVTTGIIYCSVITGCQQVFALDRAREWTSALAEWCQGQPQLVVFSGACRVHRAEVMQLGGSWPEAIAEARRACEGPDRQAVASALYQQAEIHRLRGEHAEAEAAYRSVSRHGVEPQPGLSLLRLAQGDRDAAASASRRMLAGTSDPLARVRFLPAHVEIMLAAGDRDAARLAADELAASAAALDSEVLRAIAAHARGSVSLAEGDAAGALAPLRQAFELWQRLEAPYLAARLRVLMGHACRALGDAEGSELELGAAHEVFVRLGARPDVAAVEALLDVAAAAPAGAPRGLTGRELQVLRLVAQGKTNRAIAAELGLSEKTIDRHLSNIFNKVDVSSRAAATAFAYEHRLV